MGCGIFTTITYFLTVNKRQKQRAICSKNDEHDDKQDMKMYMKHKKRKTTYEDKITSLSKMRKKNVDLVTALLKD